MPKEDEKEKKLRWAVGQIATQTAPVIVDTTITDPKAIEKGENTLTVELALAKIMNDLEDLKSLL